MLRDTSIVFNATKDFAAFKGTFVLLPLGPQYETSELPNQTTVLYTDSDRLCHFESEEGV